MSFSVTILGSSSAKPTLSRHPSAQAVNVHEQYYLVDAGEGVQQQLIRCGINPLKLRAVFISHLHGDHVFGLFPLISTLALYGRKTPLRVFAPAPFGEILACHLRFFDSELPYPVVWTEVDTTKHALLLENRTLEVWSDQPAIQFYCGNFFDGSSVGKTGKPLRYRESVALETQKYPDSPNHPAFPSTTLRPGETYTHTCIYRFGAE